LEGPALQLNPQSLTVELINVKKHKLKMPSRGDFWGIIFKKHLWLLVGFLVTFDQLFNNKVVNPPAGFLGHIFEFKTH
jgi:hypothetical protein